MSVRKLSPGVFCIRWRVGGRDGTRRQETFRGTFDEARKRESVLRGAAARQARPQAGERITLRRLWEQYEARKLPPLKVKGAPPSPVSEAAKRGRRLSESWSESTRRAFDVHFLPRWGARRVDELRASDVIRFQHEREGEVSGASVNREVAVLMAVLNFGESEDVIERNPIPAKKIKAFREQRRTRVFTEEEFGRLLHAFDDAGAWVSYRSSVRRLGPVVVNPEQGTERRHGGGRIPGSRTDAEYLERLRRSADIFAALLVTACRRGEILGLRWRDVDFGRGVVHIRLPKTASRGLASKTLPLVSGLKLIIERQGRGIGDVPVFQRPGGGPWEEKKLADAFLLAVKLSKLEEDREAIPARERLTIHSTRHTAETWLARSDFAEAKRNAYLGHSGSTMADHYTHLEPADLVPLVELLSEKAGICRKPSPVDASVDARGATFAARGR